MDLPQTLASEQLLKDHKHFGQYGDIKKVIINKRKQNLKGVSEAYCYSAYVTFSKAEEASLAILAVDG